MRGRYTWLAPGCLRSGQCTGSLHSLARGYPGSGRLLEYGQADAGHSQATAGTGVVKLLKDLNLRVPRCQRARTGAAGSDPGGSGSYCPKFQPGENHLFSSYAYGQPKSWSDVDLLVVLETDNPKQKQREIALSFHGPFGLDILVWTPQEIAQRIPLGDFFLREIVTKGKTLYQCGETQLKLE